MSGKNGLLIKEKERILNMQKMNVGIIGCGNISSIYFENLGKFYNIELLACADLDVSRAKEKALEYNIPIACTVEELLANPDIALVVNLTNPNAHAEIHLKTLRAGKHSYSEKPLATELKDGEEIIALAEEKGLLVGVAPDTFLGGGIQTARKLIDDGWIGEPIAATGYMMYRGPESFHPSPGFLYKQGAGPLFDMGPYYITALAVLLGSVKSVSGMVRATAPKRVITGEINYGEEIDVEVPTHVAGLLDFQNGAIGTLIMSFDVYGTKSSNIEIHGTTGSLIVPDPNNFSGSVYVKKQGQLDFEEVPLTHSFKGNDRGIGVLDMADAIIKQRKHRANGLLGLHVLEVMHGLYTSGQERKYYDMKSELDVPASLPMDILKNGKGI